MAKLELTEGRKAIIQAALTGGLAIGRSTQPADFEAAETAVTALYEAPSPRAPQPRRSPPSFTHPSSPRLASLFAGQVARLSPASPTSLDQLAAS